MKPEIKLTLEPTENGGLKLTNYDEYSPIGAKIFSFSPEFDKLVAQAIYEFFKEEHYNKIEDNRKKLIKAEQDQKDKIANDLVKAKAKAAKERADADLKLRYDQAFLELQKTYPELVRYAIAHAYLGDYLFAFTTSNPKGLFFCSSHDQIFIDSWVKFHDLIEKYPNPKEIQKSYLTNIKF